MQEITLMGGFMQTSQKVKNIMVHHEGLRLKPYLCPATIWTVGVGSVLYQDQIKLPNTRVNGYVGMVRNEYPLRQEHNRMWSQEEVMELFSKDLATFERGVIRLFPSGLNQNRFDALVSLAFNIGLGNVQRSTIRMRHNRGDYEGAAEAFMMWTKAGGRELPGLVKRRRDERAVYLG
jgi:lysozyme